jgi:hypothetical protein
LVLQAIGGGLSATSSTTDEEWTGIHVMIAGLAFQVLSLTIFSALCAELALHIHRMHPFGSPSRRRREAKGSLSLQSLHVFELALVAATVFILVRSIYRCAELAGGFRGKLANEEAPFMVLEGVMIILACLCLTVWHPGWVLKNGWGQAAGRTKGAGGNELIGMAGNIDGAAEGTRGYINIGR